MWTSGESAFSEDGRYPAGWSRNVENTFSLVSGNKHISYIVNQEGEISPDYNYWTKLPKHKVESNIDKRNGVINNHHWYYLSDVLKLAKAEANQ